MKSSSYRLQNNVGMITAAVVETLEAHMGMESYVQANLGLLIMQFKAIISRHKNFIRSCITNVAIKEEKRHNGLDCIQQYTAPQSTRRTLDVD